MKTITRHDDGRCTWPCQACGHQVTRWPDQSDTDCPHCLASYNAFGQRLRDDWRANPSNYDDEIGDLEGYELAALRRDAEMDGFTNG